MTDNIYGYLEANFNIKVTDYIFKRDYIINPLKRGINQYDTEHFHKEDLEYMFLTLNIRLKDLAKMFNVTVKSIRNELKYNHIKKKQKLAGINTSETNRNHSFDVKEKIKNKIMSKMMVGGVYQNNVQKRHETCLKKYGYISVMGKDWSEETKQIVKNKKSLENYIITNRLDNTIRLANSLGISQPVVNKIIKKFGLRYLIKPNVSNGELEVREFVKQYFEIDNNTKDIVKPYELDIYIPKISTAIEYNGDYWHSQPKAIKNDNKKKQMCDDKGIKLIIIKEHDWIKNKERTKKRLLEELGI